MSIITRSQLRAARSLLEWSQDQLATASGVSLPTIKRLEPGAGPLSTRVDTLEKLTRALEAAGVIFIPEDRHGPGVRLLRTSAFEAALAALVELHGGSAHLDRVDVIVAGLPVEDRPALSPLFGDRVWGEPRREADPRGCEIQDRLVRIA